MTSQKNLLLPDALDLVIKKLVGGFNKDWLVVDSPLIDIRRTGCTKSQAEMKYFKVMEPHSHHFTELFMCVKGRGALLLRDCVFEVGEGDVALILPGQLHHELPMKDCSYTAIWMSIDYNKVMLHMIEASGEKEVITGGGYFITPEHAYNFLLQSIVSELGSGAAYALDSIKTYILQLLVKSFRWISSRNSTGVKNQTWKEMIVIEVENFIKENLSNPLRLEDVSRVVCISPNHLNTIFKSVTGKTIMQYVQESKVETAKSLLANDDITISSVAARLGYYDQYHFAKAFKKETGISPTQFRRNELEITSDE